MHNTTRGSINYPEAYARAKMLDHSGWNGLLPRKITPSDIDAVIDDGGKLLFIEFSTKTAQWQNLPYGQLTMYTNAVRAGTGDIMAVCAQITPKPDQPIDTVKDVQAFQILYAQHGKIKTTAVYTNDGDRWPKFVANFRQFMSEE